MQPFFPQRQWEETVDKMVKVYGAQMDQEQRSGIVQYLVTTHGPDSPRSTAQDEDSDFAPIGQSVRPPETTPLLALASEGEEHTKQVKHGAELFEKYCAACHGVTGQGDGFIASVLLRKPKNLATTRFSVNFVSHILWNGKRGTAMPSWRGLQKTDLAALAACVLSLHQPGHPELVSAAVLKTGNELFQKNCAACHGVSGDGNGPSSASLLPEPANFKLKQPDFEYIVGVLKEGIPGTAMPSWKDQISEADRRALASFVQSIFEF